MSTITVTIPIATQPGVLPAGVVFGAINVVVKDNSGAVLPGVNITAAPWVATFTGTDGPNEAQATITPLDSKGNALSAPIVITQTGTGGQPQTYPQPAGGSIVVTG